MLTLKNRPITTKGLKKDIALAKSFAEAHVDLREYLDEDVYLLANGDLGIVYEFDGIYDEVLTEEELTDKIYPLYKAIRTLCTSIPSHEDFQNTVIQLICSQRQEQSERTKKTKGYQFSKTITGDLLKSEQDFLFDLGMVKRRFFLCVRFSPEKNEKTLWKKIIDAGSGYFINPQKQLNDKWQKIHDNYQTFNKLLKSIELEISSEIGLKRLPFSELITYFENILHGAKDGDLTRVSDTNIQKVIYNPKLESKKDGLSIEDSKEKRAIKCMFMEGLPSGFRLGTLKTFIDSIPLKDFDLVWCFSHGRKNPSQELAVKAAWFERGPSYQKQYDDVVKFQSEVQPLVPYGIQSLRLLTYEDSEQMEAVIKGLGVDILESRLILEDQIPIHMISTSLPLCCQKEAHKVDGRFSTVRLEHAALFFPVYDGPKSREATRSFISRNGIPTSFDIYAGSGNKMTTILGTSGAGKSCLTNQLIMEFMERFPDGLIRIIDKKTSYEKLADLVGGKVVRFSEAELKKDPYSPFAIKEPDEDDIESVYILIASAILQKNKDANLTSLHTEILREAIKIAYNNQMINQDRLSGKDVEIDPHPIWTDILASLSVAEARKKEAGIKDADKVREDLARWSVNLGQTGQYGFLFCAHEPEGKSSTDAKFLVYDLDGIADPVLRALGGQMAFIKISRDLSKAKKSVPKLVIFEELGILLQGDDKAQKQNEEFIQNVVKTCRKYNAQAVALTNEVEDFSDKPAGRTFWNIATQRLFLPLGNALVEKLKDKFPSEFNDADLQILSSLRLEKDYKRSALYVMSNNDEAPFKGSVYLPLSPSIDALSTSSPKQLELYSKLKDEGKNVIKALGIMTEKYPYGEGL